MDLSYIVGDSRLTGLQYYVNIYNTESLPIYVIKRSGKGICELTSIVKEKTENHPAAKVILVGGICDCTVRNENSSNPNDKFIFNFPSAEVMVEHLHSLYKDSHKDLAHSRPNVRISYSELIGTYLEASPHTRNPEPGQQDMLNEAIVSINKKIVALNESNNVPTPWISQRVHINRKNGVHHKYERLIDGIHWDESLKRICAKKFVETLYKMH